MGLVKYLLFEKKYGFLLLFIYNINTLKNNGYIAMNNDIEQISKQVLTECEYFMNQSNEHVLYRGFRPQYLSNEYYTVTSGHVQNRRSRSRIKEELVYQINYYSKTNYGFPFRDSLCCTGSYRIASSFSGPENVCAVFPIDRFRYLWSPIVGDWGETFGVSPLFNEHPDVQKCLTSLLNEHLDEGISSGNEVAIFCEQVYAIPIIYHNEPNPLLTMIYK